jgi:hypothetical protein
MHLRDLGVLNSLGDQFAQFEVVLGQHEGCEFQPADLSHFHVIEPAEGVGEQFAMGGSDCSLEVLLAKVALFFLVEEAKEGDAIEVGYICEGFSEGFDRLCEEGDFCKEICEDCAGFDGEHVLLVVGHND